MECPDRVFVRCLKCSEPISGALTRVTDRRTLTEQDGEELLEPNTFMLAADFLGTDEVFYGLVQNEILVNRGVLYAIDCGKRIGCCGPDGSDGLNLACSAGHEIGTEVGDCWQPHFVHVALDRVTLVSAG